MPSASAAGAGSTSKTTKPFSISLGSKSKSAVAAKPNPKKRPFASLVTEDSGSDDDSRHGGSQLISSFDHSGGGAITVHKIDDKGPLVIPAQKNSNWYAEALRKRGKNLLPAEEQARREGRTDPAAANGELKSEEDPVYGLVVVKKNKKDDRVDLPMRDAVDPVTRESITLAEQIKPKTEDEEALDALLGKEKESTLVIEQSNPVDHVDEGDAPSLADYDMVPVEVFGAAILRGLSWKEGDPTGRRKGTAVNPRVVERRPALLGIGAKAVPDGLEEPGAWGKGIKKNSAKIDRSYKPFMLRNAETGEILTEEELKARKEQDRLVEEDWKVKDERHSAANEDDEMRRYREPDGKRHHEEDRHNSSKRDRSRSMDRRDRRDRGHRRGRDYDDRLSEPSLERHSRNGRGYERSRHSDRGYENGRDYDRRHDEEHRDRDEEPERRRRDQYGEGSNGGHYRRHKDSDRHGRHRHEDENRYKKRGDED